MRALVAVCAGAAGGGATLVGVDSGPAHLAASVGLPVVVLEGPCDERRTGPWPVPERAPSPHRVVRSSDPPDCAPCLSRSCAHARGPVCMSELEPQLVLAACGSAQ